MTQGTDRTLREEGPPEGLAPPTYSDENGRIPGKLKAMVDVPKSQLKSFPSSHVQSHTVTSTSDARPSSWAQSGVAHISRWKRSRGGPFALRLCDHLQH